MSGLLSGGTFGLIGQVTTTPNVLQSLVSPTFVGSMLGRGLASIGIGDIPNLTLVLGGVPFFDIEVPEVIHGGGEQAMVVHKYPGGKRTIDTMGPDDAVLKWEGWFENVLAESRARQLDSIRRQGKAVICSWSSYYYLVVVKSFSFRYNRFFHIGYELVLEIVQDLVAARSPPSSDVDASLNKSMASINKAVSGTVGAITGLPSAMLNQGVGPALDGFGGQIQDAFSGVADGGTMLSSLSSNPMTISSELPGISTPLGAADGLTGNAVPVLDGVSQGIGGQSIAQVGSPLAQQLDASPGSFTAGGYDFGWDGMTAGTAAQSINSNLGSYSPSGAVSSSFPIPPIPPVAPGDVTVGTLGSSLGVNIPVVRAPDVGITSSPFDFFSAIVPAPGL